MKQDLFQYIATQSGSMTLQEIVVCFLAAVIASAVIFISYRFSHASTVYSAKFNVSLVMLTIITTLIMSVIGNNVALSLGMVGALSIVRFRTAIKDPRDTAYIFWCIAVGVACGSQDYTIAALGSAVVFFVMLFLGNVRSNDRYLLIVRGKDCAETVDNIVRDAFGNKVTLRVENQNREEHELIYEVSEKVLRDYEGGHGNSGISGRLMDAEGVISVNLVCQNDEITR